jgi:tol-pal system protein YbgF
MEARMVGFGVGAFPGAPRRRAARRLTLAATVGLALLLPAPRPAAQNREHLQLAAELRVMREEQQQLAQALAQLGEALKAVNARIDEVSAASRKGFADQSETLKGVGLDVNAIRERTQDTATRVNTLGDEVDALRLTMASLPALITQSVQALQAAMPAPLDAADPTAPAVAAAPSPAPAPITPAPPPTAGLSPTRLYDTAWADYTSGQYKLAVTGFEQFVRTFPTSERADDAQYLIGDALFAMSRFDDAIAAYTSVIQKYPNGDQVHMAYYKRGVVHERNRRPDEARADWELVVTLHPESDGARLAKQGLDRVGRTAPRP